MSLQDGALIGDSNLGLERKENRLRCIQLPWRAISLDPDDKWIRLDD